MIRANKKHFVAVIIFIIFGLSAQPVSAHAFGATYTLPIPFWLYLYTGAAALLLSFLIIGFFFKSKNDHTFPTRDISHTPVITWLRRKSVQRINKGLSLFLLLLTICTGLFGEDISAFNFNMTFFWVIFVLGFTYLTFFLGNMWHACNPWKIVVEIYERITRKKIQGILVYPKKLQIYPALLLYVIFIGIELLAGSTPFSLSVFLIQYTFLTFFAAVLFGKESWFSYGEFFSVFFRLISYCSLVGQEEKKLMLQVPFTGLLRHKLANMSMLLFILFMLSSTAYDGFRETNTWFSLYWDYLDPLLSPVIGSILGFQLVGVLGLLLSPFLFLVLYLGAIFGLKKLVATKKSVLEIAYYFALSLLPIAFVYNVAHYFTLLVQQGPVIVRLVSDPFGWNWNLFGTATLPLTAIILPASFVWHFQVFLILFGHIISVYLAHILALRLFASNKLALLSQLPMLLLMIAYTVIGLWILSQPIGIR